MTNQQTLVDYLEGYADEARRLTSSSGSMTLAQIQTALESVTPGGGTDTLADFVAGTMTSYTNSDVTSVRDFLFASQQMIQSLSFPNATTLGASCFTGCSGLTSFNAPLVQTAGSTTFNNCTSMSSFSFPNMTTAGAGTFQNCSGATSVSLPTLTTSGNGLFVGCTNLTSVDLSALVNSGLQTTTMFQSCSSLVSVALPSYTGLVGQSFFSNCSSLSSAYIHQPIGFGNYAFTNCSYLTTVIIDGLSSGSGQGLYMWESWNSGYIYVPDSQLSSIKTKTGFNKNPDRIKPWSQLPDYYRTLYNQPFSEE